MQTINISNQNFDFIQYCNQRRTLVETKLTEYLSIGEPAKLWESMRYSVLSGGKRMRALLCLASAEVITTEDDNSFESYLPCSCALEMVHAMSLIHDDLPSMDNDDYRRGKLTNHKVYGEAIALLAGDALLMLAIEILIKHTPISVDRSLLLEVVNELTRATGAPGMVGGQVLDLSFTGIAVESSFDKNIGTAKQAETIEAIHNGKTAALIRFAIWSGAKLALGNENQLKTLDEFAQRLGLAFQIADDILDSTGDLSTLGKTPGKDRAANKTTWVTVFGPAKAQEKLKTLEKEGLDILDSPILDSKRTQPLKELLKYAIYREK